jgi:penicillin amidase
MKMKPALLLLLVFALLLAGAPRHVATTDGADLAAQARRVLAQTSGRISVPGLRQAVTVLRDPWGIPHIYAETQDDLFFAQGFVAAQDRLWQMELWRRTGEGKLAEMLGPSAIERDRFARLLRYRGDMKAEYDSYAPDAREIIAAFVRGVNFFIESARKDDRLPIEFQLAGFKPEPWTPEVCLTRMAGYVMTRNASNEVMRAQLVREIGAELVEELVGTDPPRKLEVPLGLDLEGIDSRILAMANAAGGSVSFRQNEGSNNWVVDGRLTSTGKPLLANDPHRTIALPSLRYLVHLVGPGWNVIGAGEPSLPGVAAGHNERVGFGFTIVGIDQQDLYVEETHPANPHEYRARVNGRSRWVKMRVEREQIKVKGQTEPVEVALKFTAHGPVIYEDPARHRAYALRWVGTEPGTAGYLASLSLNRARNWQEFLRALERWKVPSENLVYADVDGNIGWQAAGLTPVRRGWSGLLPVPGAEGRYEWQGFLPLSELPRAYNPPQHFLATANHNILPPGYQRELGYDWAAPFRFRRIAEVLSSARSKFTVADFERLQHDEVSLPARELTRLLREAKGASEELRPYVDLLTEWDGALSKDSAAAALFQVWLTKLTPAVFKPRLPAQVWARVGGRISLVKTIETLQQPSARWFGEQARAGRDAALLTALEEAVADAQARLGRDLAQWRWGTLHTAQFRHTLSTDEARRALFDLPAVARGGDGNTVNATGGGNFRQSSGASFRQILGLNDWDASVATSVPGQSGQPQSPHYGDLLPLWAEGRYFPLLYSKKKVEEMTKERLVLEPLR